MNQKLTDEDAQLVYDAYYIGESQNGNFCAAEMGVSMPTLASRWHKLKLELRTPAQEKQAAKQRGRPWNWNSPAATGITIEEMSPTTETSPAPVIEEKRRKISIDEEALRSLYYGRYIGESWPLSRCADELDVPAPSLRRRWDALGLPLRTASQTHQAVIGELWVWPPTEANPADEPTEGDPSEPGPPAESDTAHFEEISATMERAMTEFPSPPAAPQAGDDTVASVRRNRRKATDADIERVYRDYYIGQSWGTEDCAAELGIAGKTFSDHCGRLDLRLRDVWEGNEAARQRGQRWEWSADSPAPAGERETFIVEESGNLTDLSPGPGQRAIASADFDRLLNTIKGETEVVASTAAPVNGHSRPVIIAVTSLQATDPAYAHPLIGDIDRLFGRFAAGGVPAPDAARIALEAARLATGSIKIG
jgi:hypothetical protein